MDKFGRAILERSEERGASIVNLCERRTTKLEPESARLLSWSVPYLANFFVAPHLHCLSSAHSSRLEIVSTLGRQMSILFCHGALVPEVANPGQDHRDIFLVRRRDDF